jgi:hypothetical protein
MTTSPFEPDVSVLCLRIARKLEEDGYRHPVEAAVALTVRGRQGLTGVALADVLQIDPELLTRAEQGELGVGEWPSPLWDLVEQETPEFATLLRPARSHPAGRQVVRVATERDR